MKAEVDWEELYPLMLLCPMDVWSDIEHSVEISDKEFATYTEVMKMFWKWQKKIKEMKSG